MLLKAFFSSRIFLCFDPLFSKVSRPDKLAVHVFEVDEDVDKDEVSLISVIPDHRGDDFYIFNYSIQC